MLGIEIAVIILIVLIFMLALGFIWLLVNQKEQENLYQELQMDLKLLIEATPRRFIIDKVALIDPNYRHYKTTPFKILETHVMDEQTGFVFTDNVVDLSNLQELLEGQLMLGHVYYRVLAYDPINTNLNPVTFYYHVGLYEEEIKEEV